MSQALPSIQIFNTMSRRKEEFVPLEPGKVKLYACGPTVYNLFHLGNARMLVTFDLFRCFLEAVGYEVTFVQNFTDIDDKVIRKANEEGCSFEEIADRYIQEYFYDADRLGVRRATLQPRATETMEDIIAMIQTLMDKGYCYVTEDGVYFEAKKFERYGQLSKQPLEDLMAEGGQRELFQEQKRHPADFAVWKFAKPGEPQWDTPWGAGRPGWHIECSAMNEKYLGKTIDIHCGGSDLVFPHHENEIAQSEAAHSCTFARYWMHNGFINVDNSKMSKSKGNFFTVRDLAKQFPYEVLRYFMLLGHYRSPINFSTDLLEAASRGYERIMTCAQNVRFHLQSMSEADQASTTEENCFATAQWKDRFIEAMADDLNTPQALATIFDLVSELNQSLAQGGQSSAYFHSGLACLEELMGILGFRLMVEEEIPQSVLALVEARTQAKKERNFQEADRIRDELTKAGYKLEDTPQGTKVSRA